MNGEMSAIEPIAFAGWFFALMSYLAYLDSNRRHNETIKKWSETIKKWEASDAENARAFRALALTKTAKETP